ncbi:methyltransferase domain-containing protein [Enterovirga sp. CN4-39]|uniref:methyltransferase domain-containing protein n=1 Tax=Enterovirga sp. CN4-39 TaxID=3400910 RepID=UPI003C12A027
MSVDVTDLRAFYAGPLGHVARRVVTRTLAQFWPDLRGLSVLGLGYAVPFLAELDGTGPRLAFMPGWQGVVNWPASGLSASALVDPMMMPLADGSVDRVLVVHALETVASPAELLNEVWRILTPGGRLVLVCPNRRGVWSRVDTTPFGHGQPFSRRQLRHLMKGALFSPESWAEILYVPPLRSRFLLSGAGAWEGLGRSLSLPFAGLHMVDATKQLHRPIPVYERRRSRQFAPVLVPRASPVPTAG